MRSSTFRTASLVQLPATGRLLVTGDLHDNPEYLRKIVQLARLDASADRHVVLHEIIHSERLVNNVDLSHRMLARVAELIVAYPQQVHVVLANHELAQMTGQGVSKGAGNSVELFYSGLQYVFSDDWEAVSKSINSFIRAMPLALTSESGLFCAHSLPAPRSMAQFDLGVLQRELTDEDYRSSTGSAYLMVWGRGHTPEQIERLAEHWQVNLFCLGHENIETGLAIHGERVIVLNSDHEAATVLPIDLANLPTTEEAAFAAIRLRGIPLQQ